MLLSANCGNWFGHQQAVAERERLNPHPLVAVVPRVKLTAFIDIHTFGSRQAQQHVRDQPARDADAVLAVAAERSGDAVMFLQMAGEPGLHIAVRDADEPPGLPAIELAPPVPKREVSPLDRFAGQMQQQLRMQILAAARLIIRWIPNALGNQIFLRQPIRIRLKLIDRP
jgi:hypothetical protein